MHLTSLKPTTKNMKAKFCKYCLSKKRRLRQMTQYNLLFGWALIRSIYSMLFCSKWLKFHLIFSNFLAVLIDLLFVSLLNLLMCLLNRSDFCSSFNAKYIACPSTLANITLNLSGKGFCSKSQSNKNSE